MHLAIHDDFIVDAELAFRHPGQVGLHHDLAGNMGGQHLAHHTGEVQLSAVQQAAPGPGATLAG